MTGRALGPAARVAPALVAVATLLAPSLAGCASSDPGRGRPRPSAAAPARPGSTEGAPTVVPASTVPAPAIVGEWTRFQRCDQMVLVLRAAGMGRTVATHVAGDGWVPGVTDPEQVDPRRPCRDARDRHQTHYFTADGRFGSLDADGDPVDVGAYRLIGTDHVVIGGVTFRYTVTDGVDLALVPVLPRCSPGCPRAQWSVLVAYPGYFWHRRE